jgi:hypothetical protein
MGEIGYLFNDGSMVVGSPDCYIVGQCDDMVPCFFVDLVRWGLLRPLGQSKITLEQDAPSRSKVILWKETRHG